MIEFTVPAVPVAMPRPRGMMLGGHVHMHNPTHRKLADGRRVSNGVAEFKASVRMAFAAVYSGPPLEGPIRMTAVFVLPRPKGLIWKTKPMPRLRHTSKPDLDNLEKTVKDALKGLAWGDDSQVCLVEKSKWVASGSEQPSVALTIACVVDPSGLFVEEAAA